MTYSGKSAIPSMAVDGMDAYTLINQKFFLFYLKSSAFVGMSIRIS